MSNGLRKVPKGAAVEAKVAQLTPKEVGILIGLNTARTQAIQTWDRYLSDEIAKRLGVHPSRLGQLDFDTGRLHILPEPPQEPKK